MKNYPERIYLCGFMGAGKTTISRLLASRIRHIFIDLDHYIEKKEHKTVSAIFSKLGENHFRKLEQKYLRELSAWNSVVVALGGGTLSDFDTVELVKKSGLLIFINIDIPTVLSRVKRNRKRPLLLDQSGAVKPDDVLENELSELYDRRRPLYEMAHITIHQNMHDPAEKLLEQLIRRIEEFDTSV